MRAVNRFKVDRFPDYVVLRLGMSHSTDRGDLGPDPIEVVVPITVSAAVGLSLFESVLLATADLTRFFTMFQQQVNNLNAVSAKVEKEKQEVIASADAPKETQ
jgi:hypothetical protein